jgi:hypothetical protein
MSTYTLAFLAVAQGSSTADIDSQSLLDNVGLLDGNDLLNDGDDILNDGDVRLTNAILDDGGAVVIEIGPFSGNVSNDGGNGNEQVALMHEWQLQFGLFRNRPREHVNLFNYNCLLLSICSLFGHIASVTP